MGSGLSLRIESPDRTVPGGAAELEEDEDVAIEKQIDKQGVSSWSDPEYSGPIGMTNLLVRVAPRPQSPWPCQPWQHSLLLR